MVDGFIYVYVNVIHLSRSPEGTDVGLNLPPPITPGTVLVQVPPAGEAWNSAAAPPFRDYRPAHALPVESWPHVEGDALRRRLSFPQKRLASSVVTR